MVRTCGNGGKPHRDQRQFRPAREGEASILSDQVGPTAGPDQREPVVATLPVTSELIDVGAASFLTPRLDPCSPGVLWPRPTRRAAIRNHATSLAKVAPFSALTRERKP